jgi:hypothetical protein
LDFHAAAATQVSARKSQQMTELAKQDNDLMFELSRKSQADARTLKSITILTLFYLPASFVSVSKAAERLDWHSTNPGVRHS